MMLMKRGAKDGVSAVIAVILMVAITVVLAGVLYVWVMGMANTNTTSALRIGVAGVGETGGYKRLEVASVSGGSVVITDITLKIKRGGAAITVGDFSNATVTNNGNSTTYAVDSDSDGNDDFIIYDNDQNEMLTKGDVIAIEAGEINTGDQIDITVSGTTMILTRF